MELKCGDQADNSLGDALGDFWQPMGKTGFGAGKLIVPARGANDGALVDEA
jgi:hypothetical protein